MSPDVAPRTVVVPPERLARWVENFASRHEPGGAPDASPRSTAVDGSWFEVTTVFDSEPVALEPGGGVPELPGAPVDWGVLLVRKGGFAVARLHHDEMRSSKVGRRHVQGRTKAGGQSQQRFARRRANQAKAAMDACADHAAQHLAGLAGPLLTGGDEQAVREVLRDPRLAGLVRGFHGPDVVEPRRDTLEEFVHRCLSWQVRVLDTTR